VLGEGGVVATIYDNVRGRLVVFERGQSRWHERNVHVPDNVSVHLGDSSKESGRFFYSVEGFLTPSTLSLADTNTGATETLRSAPARFDASTHVVEQFEATSSDGTKIPYFVTRPRDLVMDGHAPTIIYGYGGFQVSKPPAYIAEMGKLWLENGGVYVNANIRGGGEFGPEWHQSVLNENRQLAFDDFAAVAADLHRRGITSPRRTGIYGRSNGGVLTSVTMTQHPELINAAVIESPLIDMLRYHELPAGGLVDRRIRRSAHPGRSRLDRRLLRLPEPSSGCGLSACLYHDQHPRRPRPPGSCAQIRRPADRHGL